MDADYVSNIAGKTRDEIDSILLLSGLIQAGIENETIKSTWDLYLIFEVFKLLCLRSVNNLKKIQD